MTKLPPLTVPHKKIKILNVVNFVALKKGKKTNYFLPFAFVLLDSGSGVEKKAGSWIWNKHHGPAALLSAQYSGRGKFMPLPLKVRYLKPLDL